LEGHKKFKFLHPLFLDDEFPSKILSILHLQTNHIKDVYKNTIPI